MTLVEINHLNYEEGIARLVEYLPRPSRTKERIRRQPYFLIPLIHRSQPILKKRNRPVENWSFCRRTTQVPQLCRDNTVRLDYEGIQAFVVSTPRSSP
jgi:hypothetical protein